MVNNKKRLYIGDIIMSQITMYISKYKKKETKRLIFKTSKELDNLLYDEIELKRLKLDPSSFREIWFSVGYNDLIVYNNIDECLERIDKQIKYILSKNKNLFFIIPKIKDNNSNNNFIRELEEIIITNNLSYLDLKDIIQNEDINFTYGIYDTGLNCIINYLIEEDYI